MNLSFFRNFFNNQSSQILTSLFDNAPFLSPWYFRDDKPSLTQKGGQQLKWKFIEKVNGEYIGVMTLLDNSNNVLGFMRGDNYVHPSLHGTKFLVWNRVTKTDTTNPCIFMHLYDTSQLRQLEKGSDAILEFHKSKRDFYFGNKPVATLKYIIEPSMTESSVSFPEDFKTFEPFLAVTNYEGLYNGSKGLGDTVILEFNSQANKITFYPQDWFNKSNADFGYEWITRAIKDKNGFIHGQGFRISDFTLDMTGTELKR